MKRVKALVLTGFGLNCDMETARSFELAGAEAERVHINALVHGDTDIEAFQILCFGGGFSWGDDHGAGVIQALKIKKHLGDSLLSFIDRGGLIIGICNGFQTLVNLGLLPGLDREYTKRSVSVTWNDCGNFRDQWVHLSVNPNSPCVFTKGMDKAFYPVRHGEGKFYTDEKTLSTLFTNEQVVLRYADEQGKAAEKRFPENPNGSEGDVAGICDPTGRVFGLMPHPEAYNHFTNDPGWTREKSRRKRAGTSADLLSRPLTAGGIRIFKNGVDYMA